MAWDRTQRPRNPRARASKRNVSALGDPWRAFAWPDSRLSDDDVTAIIKTITSAKFTAHLPLFLPQLDRQYNHSKLETPPPRSETRYQLQMIAHLAWKLEQVPCDLSGGIREIGMFARILNRETRSLLEPRIRELSDGYFYPNFCIYFGGFAIDPLSFGEAALEAERQLAGAGDYKNDGLTEAIATLLFLYDVATGVWPTFWLAPIGPDVAAGSRRQVVGSECGKFLLAFFERVDPELSATQVTNGFKQQLARNRARQRDDPPYYRDLCRR